MTEQEIFQVPLPEKTASYTPVPHEQIVEKIYRNMDKTGLRIANKRYKVGRNGRQLTGIFDLTSNDVTFNYQLAFRNSYDKSMSVAFVTGATVLVCTNGMILGDQHLIRKHTGTVVQEITDKIQYVIGNLDGMLDRAEKDSERMKSIELDETATAELCGRLFMEQDIISSSQLNIIRQQLKKPDYEDFTEPNLWSLYNHTTHALKKTHAYGFIDKHKKLHDFVSAEYQF